MAHSTIGRDRDVLTVIFEFDTEPDRQRELSETIQGLVTDIVRHQPGFLASHLHLSTDGEKVLNYFQWESREAFDTFRADDEAQGRIRPAITPFGPKPRVYEIVFSAAA
jgi:quinol monooxygenase YgiN